MRSPAVLLCASLLFSGPVCVPKWRPPFRYIKQVFGCSKVRYRGLANNNRLHFLAAFSNLLIGENYMLA